ncbi:MAG: glycosyltransferase [Ramlibacter sp.]|nr:glycosyltransferase [Ramlibacter sp.]
MKSNEPQRDRVFFSIVIASYNVKDDLIACIESIQNQIFSDYELLISDGGSIDGTSEYISSTPIANLAWYKSASDNGIYDALNIAIEHTSGKWILILGADDRLADSDALVRAHRQINRLGVTLGIAYSDLFISSHKGVVLKKYPELDEFERRYRGGAFIHHQSAFVARESVVRAGKFSRSYMVHSDYDLMLKVLKCTGAVKIRGAFVVFNSEGYSSKLSTLWKSFAEIYRIRKLHGYPPMPLRILASYCALLTRRLVAFNRINSPFALRNLFVKTSLRRRIK